MRKKESWPRRERKEKKGVGKKEEGKDRGDGSCKLLSLAIKEEGKKETKEGKKETKEEKEKKRRKREEVMKRSWSTRRSGEVEKNLNTYLKCGNQSFIAYHIAKQLICLASRNHKNIKSTVCHIRK